MVSGAASLKISATSKSAKAIKLSRCAIPLGISTLIRFSTPILTSSSSTCAVADGLQRLPYLPLSGKTLNPFFL